MPAGLVVGGNGLIGSQLLRCLEDRGWTTVGTTRRTTQDEVWLRFDLADPPSALLSAGAVRSLSSQGGWVVFLTAGINGHHQCAQDPVGTRRINVTNSIVLAEHLMAAGGFVIYPSSSAVFGETGEPCDESSPPSPTSEYGRQKADTDTVLLRLMPRVSGAGVAVVRLTKVVAATGLMGQWMEALKSGGVVEAATNRWLSPISLPFAVRGLIAIAEGRQSGLYHLAGESAISYFELAVRLAVAIEAKQAQVRPVELGSGNVSGPFNSAPLNMSETMQRTALHPQSLDSVVADLLASR